MSQLDPPNRHRPVAPASILCLSVWLVLFLLWPASAFSQISPGELSKSHSSLEGPLQCAQCHTFGAGRPELKCLGCHTEIQHRIAAKQGYHARVVDLSKGQVECARCHAEHNGKNFDIIRWPVSESKFDHREAGFILEGRHASLNCRQCHRAQNLAPVSAATAPKNPGRTFLALSSQCIACHRDPHNRTLDKDCSRCHSVVSWKPASFNHGSARFTLTGLHEKVACEKCHHPGNTSPSRVQFRGLAFSDCTPCHADPHKGAFDAACRSCHNTAGWRTTQLSSNFDHQRTPFPLKGKHETVACAKCHKTTDFKAPVSHNKCLDCHTDSHKGQFRKRPDQGDCSSCHSESGFKPATFTEANHAQTAYPLAGQHRSLACEKCHLPAASDTNYYPKHSACLDCHRDAHEKQFAGQPHENRCESCHSVEGFRPSSFTLSKHKETRFALSGAHVAVACGDCHKPSAEAALRSPAKFHFSDLSCVSCHTDPHMGQASAPLALYDKVSAKAGCETCHSVKSWRETVGFDHEATGFSLTGAHRSVACIRCHHASDNSGSRLVVFEETPKTCSGCHKDPHGGQFRLADAEADCAKCHITARWQPSTFDHESGATFSLAGAHQRVPCQQCHQAKRESNGQGIVMYKEITKECAGCHK